jgi:peptidoglycan/xylan/chitin deacetylase (PgdA/CDA1 family)
MLSVILNFHGIGPISRSVCDGEQDCWLDFKQFEAILDLVYNKPNVLLTFDDGNISDVELALPALLQRGLTASFFLCSGRLNQPTFLSSEHVKYLVDQGMHIGSHGISHRSWRGLSRYELQTELSKSRQELEDICGMPVNKVACPFGGYNRTVLRAIKTAGYFQVYTSDDGWTESSSWFQARNTILRSYTIEDVAKLVQCKPNWFSRIITMSRRILKQCR